MRAAVLINPRAGARRGAAVAHRVELSRAALREHGADGEVLVVDGPGRGAAAARAQLGLGAETVVAWGGDGTVNEVAAQLVGRGAALGIVPAGSGNGLARELGLRRHPARALRDALRGPVRRIDAGELGGRLFFNVAGVGLDARLAAAVNARARRDMAGFAAAALREALRYKPARYTVTADGAASTARALLVAVANTRQYGNGALIAPGARPDDGRLDLVVIPPLGAAAVIRRLPHLFRGTLHRVPGVRMGPVETGEIAADEALAFHVDGEAARGGRSLPLTVHARALPVRVPAA